MFTGALMPPPSAISSVSHHTAPLPSYLMMGHHGTLRRTMIPTSMGYMPAPSPGSIGVNCGVNPLGISGLPGHPGGPTGTIYFDGTIPRSLRTGSSGTTGHPADNNSQYFYG